jgi:molybdopterin-guanine dinucleotide biosynthesis protein A
MGTAKAGLEWHGSTLLYRATAVVARAVDGPVVVVAARGQELPELPAGVAVVEDPVEGLGPMQGLAAGLAAVADRAGVAFVCSTDLPFLHPAYVRRVLRGLTDDTDGERTDGGHFDVALPMARGFRQPLAAAYRTRIAGLVADLVARGDDRPGMIFRHCAVAQLDDAALLADAELAARDPELDSVLNVNTPGDYAAARDREPPEVMVDGNPVRAATVGAAARAVGADRRAVVTVNGDRVTTDGRFPLVAGDRVAFRPAG